MTEAAHESFELRTGAEIEQVWREFWLPLLKDESGRISIERLKAELYDCHHLILNAPKVYHHVTGGLCADPCASAEGIIAMADAKRGELVESIRSHFTRGENDATDTD